MNFKLYVGIPRANAIELQGLPISTDTVEQIVNAKTYDFKLYFDGTDIIDPHSNGRYQNSNITKNSKNSLYQKILTGRI